MGMYLSTPKTDKTSEDGENDKLKYGASSMQGWRHSMEDAHAALLDLDNSTSFFGVFDGHGVLKHEAYSVGDIGIAAQKSFLRMDEMMCGQCEWRELSILGMEDDSSSEEGLPSNYDGPTCGSTACVAIIHNNQLIVANAGDSRCVISQKGQACDLSKDHKPDLEVEKERIYEAGCYIEGGRVNGSLNLARAIGDMELKRDTTLPPEKQILTANPDINTESKLKAVCEKVFDRCLAPTSGGEGYDNMTMILVQFKKPKSAPSTSQPLDESNDQEVPESN
ncbi:hypothetical protein L1987_08153 [Smallanthus sonchifolius]|uniref:Uncharacterized protein n=1 Tax=Smallanthus sonchifolius TaxID=185202 RepID=A0ACB9JJY3_9ASTR|nr:hypothetical protein L1987_08153 [Smallanthus sonchifolius]